MALGWRKPQQCRMSLQSFPLDADHLHPGRLPDGMTRHGPGAAGRSIRRPAGADGGGFCNHPAILFAARACASFVSAHGTASPLRAARPRRRLHYPARARACFCQCIFVNCGAGARDGAGGSLAVSRCAGLWLGCGS